MLYSHELNHHCSPMSTIWLSNIAMEAMALIEIYRWLTVLNSMGGFSMANCECHES